MLTSKLYRFSSQHLHSCFLVSFLFCISMVRAQGIADTYRQSLAVVLEKVEKKFEIVIQLEDALKNKQVEYANWRFTEQVTSTLDNILKPLDLAYRQTSSGYYTVGVFEYYRRTDEAAKEHLASLIKAFPDATTFDKRKQELKKCIATALGINNFNNRTALNPIIRKKKIFDGYSTENVAFESIPGYFVTGTLYRPIGVKGPYPVILNPHGHFYNEEEPGLAKDSGRYRADMQYRCAAFAKMGAMVISYDMYAWGESAQMTGSMSFHETGFAASIQTWNSIRTLDFMLSLPDADPKRVGVTGASGGGTQTFLLAALDDRIQVSAPVVMVGASFYGGCPCESGLPIHAECHGYSTNNTEIAAMVVPKPLILVSDGDDWTRFVPGTDYPYLKTIYELYGKPENVESVFLPNDKHDYGITKREPVYRFFAKVLGLNLHAIQREDGHINEQQITIVENKALYVFDSENPLPATALRSHQAIVNEFHKVQSN